MKKNLIKVVCLVALTAMFTLALTPLLQASVPLYRYCCPGDGVCVFADTIVYNSYFSYSPCPPM